MQSLKMVLQNNFGHQDIWSEFRNEGYAKLGLSSKQLELGQAIINKAKPLLPKGGQVGEAGAGNSATIESTAPAFISQFSAMQLGLMGVGALIIVYMLARK